MCLNVQNVIALYHSLTYCVESDIKLCVWQEGYSHVKVVPPPFFLGGGARYNLQTYHAWTIKLQVCHNVKSSFKLSC